MPRADWDHDHCVACNTTVAEPNIEGADVIHDGYASIANHERRADYYWICPDCFRDFKEVMNWSEA